VGETPEIGELAWLAFPLFFAAVWTGVCWLLARIGGWHRLHQAYGDFGLMRTASRLRFRSGRLGFANYNNVLTFDVGPSGIRFSVFGLFRFGHAAFSVPWSDLRLEQRKQLLFSYVEMTFARAPGIKLRISSRLARALREAGSVTPPSAAPDDTPIA